MFANEIKATIEKRTKYPINGLSPLLTLKGGTLYQVRIKNVTDAKKINKEIKIINDLIFFSDFITLYILGENWFIGSLYVFLASVAKETSLLLCTISIVSLLWIGLYFITYLYILLIIYKRSIIKYYWEA
nr:hypothetical protein [Mycoplasmopsis bovis]